MIGSDFVKDWLERYRNTDIELDDEIERLDRISEKLISAAAPALSDLPKHDGGKDSKIEYLTISKLEIQKRVESLIEKQKEMRGQIEKIIFRLKNPREKSIIRTRYFDGADSRLKRSSKT